MDRDFMDRRYIDKTQVIERYLNQQLTDSELNQFEIYYFNHPDVVKEIEAARRKMLSNKKI